MLRSCEANYDGSYIDMLVAYCGMLKLMPIPWLELSTCENPLELTMLLVTLKNSQTSFNFSVLMIWSSV